MGVDVGVEVTAGEEGRSEGVASFTHRQRILHTHTTENTMTGYTEDYWSIQAPMLPNVFVRQGSPEGQKLVWSWDCH